MWHKATKLPVPPPDPDATAERAPWLSVLRYRQAWSVFLVRLIGDPMYGFYLYWLPEYLTRERGLDLAGVAAVAWIPFLAADIGNLAGGGFMSWLIKRGWTPHRARRTVMFACSFLAMIGMAAPFVESLTANLAILAVTCAVFMVWSVNVMAMQTDYFSAANVGTVLGLSGTGSGTGGFIKNAVVGWVIDRTGSYKAVFIGVGLLLPIATTVQALFGGPIRRVDGEQEAA